MKRSFFALVFVNLCCLASIFADESVRAAQTRLRMEGFYFGDADGAYNSETAAAVTRYQIRHGLSITGKLDSPTAQALGVSALPSPSEAPPASVAGAWHRLRNGDIQFLPAKDKVTPAVSSPAPGDSRLEARGNRATAASHQARASVTAVRPSSSREKTFNKERLRDYVGAFVLAGLDPQTGAELEFFADRVDYFGQKNVSREKIRRDLIRYDERWPQRRFSLAGGLDVAPVSASSVRVVFPLHYELGNRSKKASGSVRKTIVLQTTPNDDLQIVAVNEQKLK